MKDYAREENGGLIAMVSSSDERFPPENMLDGKDNTFWMSTGMFPQEFVLKLDQLIKVSKITTLSLNVKKLQVDKCETEKPDSFEKVFEVELPNRGDRLQTEAHQVNIRAKFLKFTLLTGYAEFATMNRVSVVGDSPDEVGGGGGGDFGAPAAAEDDVGQRQGSFGYAGNPATGNAYGGSAASPSPAPPAGGQPEFDDEF